MTGWSTFILLVAVVQPSSGDDVAARIQRGRTALDNLEYETAAEELMIAASDDRATKPQRFEANLHAGMANVVLGRDVQARLNFLHVLQREPGYALPENAPPKIRSFFELVRDEVQFTTGVGPPGEKIARPVAPANNPPTWALWVGGAALVVGGLMAAATVTTAVAVEAILSDSGRPGGQRQSLMLIGQLNVLGFAAALVPSAVGTGLLVWGLVE